MPKELDSTWALMEGFHLTLDEIQRVVPIMILAHVDEVNEDNPTVLGILAPSVDRWDSWHFWLRPDPAYLSVWSEETGEWYFTKEQVNNDLYQEHCLCKMVDGNKIRDQVLEIVKDHHEDNVHNREMETARRLLDY